MACERSLGYGNRLAPKFFLQFEPLLVTLLLFVGFAFGSQLRLVCSVPLGDAGNFSFELRNDRLNILHSLVCKVTIDNRKLKTFGIWVVEVDCVVILLPTVAIDFPAIERELATINFYHELHRGNAVNDILGFAAKHIDTYEKDKKTGMLLNWPVYDANGRNVLLSVVESSS